MVVDLGDPATAGTARSSDLLHLEVGPLARIDGTPSDAAASSWPAAASASAAWPMSRSA